MNVSCFSGEGSCAFANLPAGPHRGGLWADPGAGVFTIRAIGIPNTFHHTVGFRCAR